MQFLYTLFGMTSDAYSVPRRSERKTVRKAIVLMVESDDVQTRHEATAVDVSTHGTRVETDVALTPGQILSLIQPDDPTRALRCLVVWSGDVSTDGPDQAGLEFLASQSAGPEN